MKDPSLDYKKVPSDSDRTANKIFLWVIRIITLPVILIAWCCRMEGAITCVVNNTSANHYAVIKDAGESAVVAVARPLQAVIFQVPSTYEIQVRQTSDNGYVEGRSNTGGEYLRINVDGTITAADPAVAQPAPASGASEGVSLEDILLCIAAGLGTVVVPLSIVFAMRAVKQGINLSGSGL